MLDKKLIKNLASLFSIQGLAYLVPLITLPYFVRVLGVSAYGEVSFWQAVGQYGVILVNFGFLYSGPRQISQNSSDSMELSRIFISIIVVRVIFAFIILNVLFASIIFLGKSVYMHLSIAVWVLAVALMPVWYFQGVERMGVMAAVTFVAKCLTLPAFFIFVNSPQDNWLVIFISAIVDLILALGLLFWVFFRQEITFDSGINRQDLLQQISLGWHVFVSRIGINIYSQSTTVALGLLTNLEVVGIFSAANKLRAAIQGLLGPISQALYPRMVTLFSQSKSKAHKFLRKIFVIQVVVVFLGVLASYFLAPEILDLILGEAYLGSVSVFRILIWVPLVVAVSNIFGVQTLLAQGFDKIFSRVILFGGAWHLFFLIPAIYLFQDVGASIMILVTEVIIVALMFAAVCKHDRKFILGDK